MKNNNAFFGNDYMHNGESEIYGFPFGAYFMNNYHMYPSVYSVESVLIDKFLKELAEKDYSITNIWSMQAHPDNTYPDKFIIKLQDKIVIELSSISETYLDNFIDNDQPKKDDNICRFLNVYYANSLSPELKKLKKIIKNCVLANEDKSKIGLLVSEYGRTHIKEIELNIEDNKFDALDLHYGDGFEVYYEKLLKKIKTNKKGIVLFHGDTGTGKTYCIRNMISRLKSDKYFVLIPLDIMSNLSNPDLINIFINESKENKKDIVLVLEDAEKLLQSRDEGKNFGVSEILNVSDGILNDILGFQILATFNTKTENVDQALLRWERLIGRKEFKKLDIIAGQKLIDFLNIDMKVEKDMSLAEIYSIKNENDILLHQVEIKDKKFKGFT